jgi:calcineurin-like phosphoesterase family protein
MTIYLIIDPHFSHENIIEYCRRPFRHAEDMDEFMVERWNSVVRPSDHVYCLGDVALHRKHLSIVRRLNGKKHLVFGNHDIYDWKDYINAGFQKLMAYRVIANVILSHIPLHPNSISQRFIGNIHGHIHNRPEHPGPYYNVSVENINYTPISLEEAIKRLQARTTSRTESSRPRVFPHEYGKENNACALWDR